MDDLRRVCIVAALIVLFDSTSQLALAIMPLQVADPFWRASTLQLLSTQATPWSLTAILLVFGLSHAMGRLRIAAVALILVGVILGAAVVLMVPADTRLALETSLRTPSVFQRASRHALLIGIVAPLAAVMAGILMLRSSASAGPGPSGERKSGRS